MTYEEARRRIRMRLRSDCEECDCECKKCIDAVNLMDKAMKKMNPAKVNGDINLWTCPTCGNEYEWTPARPKYCDNCGQAFDLSGVPKWEEQWGDEE